ncbi:MAG: uracil-DNA glycosylase [Prevotellaceae bacterium]|jgi:uracil-DNA glycosylase|nr:uracil-DNA glycosylase [Prevotellaceae bacterium]
MDVKIESGWKAILKEEFEKPYFIELVNFIKKETREGRQIYPPGKLIFNAFEKTPFDRLRVVILGQDPYHGEGQAHGLSFSVPAGIPQPPSLVNIFKEIRNDLGIEPPRHGNLESWAEQGVFLLNAILTVRRSEAASHSKAGWAYFTDAVIQKISEHKSGVVFLLWGNFARQKKALIDTNRHFILESAHPSPLSANNFFGCRHFSKTNKILQQQGLPEINWAIEN